MATVENFVMLLRRDAADANISVNPTGGTYTPPFRFRVKFYQFDGIHPTQLLETRDMPLTTPNPSVPSTYSGAAYFDGSTYPAGTNMMQGVFLDAMNKQFGFVETVFPQALPSAPIQNGYIPLRGNAQYLIRDFTKLNGIQKSAGGRRIGCGILISSAPKLFRWHKPRTNAVNSLQPQMPTRRFLRNTALVLCQVKSGQRSVTEPLIRQWAR